MNAALDTTRACRAGVLRLLAQFGAPEYHVVLALNRSAFVASPQWPWK
jgi:hypothetical protein